MLRRETFQDRVLRNVSNDDAQTFVQEHLLKKEIFLSSKDLDSVGLKRGSRIYIHKTNMQNDLYSKAAL